MATQALSSPARTGTVRQFVKFGAVGVSNNVVDYLTWRFMMAEFHWGWLPAQLVAFVFSVSNGFVWNSIWTFRGEGSTSRQAQYFRFFAVNVISLGFGLLIMKSMLILLTGSITHTGPDKLIHLNIAKAVAIVLGAVWNYTLNKRWTFK